MSTSWNKKALCPRPHSVGQRGPLMAQCVQGGSDLQRNDARSRSDKTACAVHPDQRFRCSLEHGVDAALEGFFSAPPPSRSELQVSQFFKWQVTALLTMAAEDAHQPTETVWWHHRDGVDTARNGRGRRAYRHIWPPGHAELGCLMRLPGRTLVATGMVIPRRAPFACRAKS